MLTDNDFEEAKATVMGFEYEISEDNWVISAMLTLLEDLQKKNKGDADAD